MSDIAEIPAQFLKDPQAVLPYFRDWSNWLDADEAIVSSSWTVSPTGVTILLEEVIGTTKTGVWLEGGTPGTNYTVTNEITTDSSPIAKVDERSFTLVVRER
jgi:hypothetical protein